MGDSDFTFPFFLSTIGYMDYDSAALFPTPQRVTPGLDALRRRMRHARPVRPGPPTPREWAAIHEGLRGRGPSGTVHLVTDDWLPVCGAGLNGWDHRGLQPTDNAVSCQRCDDRARRAQPPPGQLALF